MRTQFWTLTRTTTSAGSRLHNFFFHHYSSWLVYRTSETWSQLLTPIRICPYIPRFIKTRILIAHVSRMKVAIAHHWRHWLPLHAPSVDWSRHSHRKLFSCWCTCGDPHGSSIGQGNIRTWIETVKSKKPIKKQKKHLKILNRNRCRSPGFASGTFQGWGLSKVWSTFRVWIASKWTSINALLPPLIFISSISQ